MEHRKVLEDAGVFDINMSESEMEDFYRAITDSRKSTPSFPGLEEKNKSPKLVNDGSHDENISSTTIEQKKCEQDLQSESDQKLGSSLSVESKSKEPVVSVDEPNSVAVAKSPVPLGHGHKSYSQIIITFEDFIDDEPVSPLKFTHHEVKFELPILRNPKYDHLPMEERVRLFEEQQSATTRAALTLSRRSLVSVPWPKPILPSTPDTFHHQENDDEFENGDQNGKTSGGGEVYISRSGRQVKRRFYNEDYAIDDDFDEDTLMSTVNHLKRSRNCLDSPNDELKLTFENFKDENEEPGPKLEKKPSIKKNARVSDVVISKNSVTLTLKKKLNRSEQIMFNAIGANEEKKLEDQRMADAVNSVQSTDDEEEVILISTQDKEDAVVEVPDDGAGASSRRIVPPLRSRQRIGTKGNVKVTSGLEHLDEVTLTPLVTPTLKKNTQQVVDCPICEKFFPKDEIEAHASNCSNFHQQAPEAAEAIRSWKTCELCDQFFPNDKDYETHFRECLAHAIPNS